MAIGGKDPDQLETSGNDPGEAEFQALLAPKAAAAPALKPGQSRSTSTTTSSGPGINTSDVYGASQALGAAPAQAQQKLDAVKTVGDTELATDVDNSRRAIDDFQTQSDATLQPLQADADRLQTQYDEISATREQNRGRFQNAINDMDIMSKNIAAAQPHDIWAEAGTGTKVALIALQGLGGLMQGVYGDKTNPVTDQIDAYIKRDLTMQRLKLEKGKEDYANKNLLLNQMSKHFDHIESAQDAAYSTAMHGIIGRLEISKGLIAPSQMRVNLEKTIGELNMKKALADQRLQANMAGLDIRAKNAQLSTEKDLAIARGKLEQSKQSQTFKESQALEKGAQTAAATQVNGWKFPEGFKAGNAQTAAKLAEGEATAKKVYKAMGRIKDELTKVKNPADLLSTEAYREYAQAESQLLEAARGPGFGNTGSRFTEMMKKLEETAFTPGALGRLTPEESKKLVTRAQINLLTNLRDAFAEHGGVPSKHEFLGGE